LIFILRAVFINLRKIYVHFSGSLDAAIALHRIVERLPQVLGQTGNSDKIVR